MFPHTRHSSGDTRGATPSTTGRSTSHRRITHLRPRYSIDIATLIHIPFVQLKWNDGYAGHGEHYFDFNHGDSYKPAPAPYKPAYSPPKPTYAGSETDEQFVEAPNSFAKVFISIFFISS